jgi:hypothetical protein
MELDGAQGKLELTNSFGEIRVSNAREAVLAIKNATGAISFSGALDESVSHRVETTFADITLQIPSDTAVTLDLETSFGDIKTDLPLTLSGELDETAWRADLNGGGAELVVRTNNGDISVLAIPTETP